MSKDADSVENPLLARSELPVYGAIEAQHVEPAVRQTLEDLRQTLRRLQSADEPTVDWLLDMERVHERLHDVWEPVGHLNAVVSDAKLRDAFNQCLPLITEFESELGQNAALYRQYLRLEQAGADESPELGELIRQAIRDFRLSGVALEGPEKREFRELMLKLASRQAAFEHNLLDATDEFSHPVTGEAELAGLPGFVVDHARAAARSAGTEGWLLKLDPPTYQAVMTQSQSEHLRELFYRAWMTRASELGPQPDRWDNGPLIEEILALRHRAARLLGFENYAELSLATKMAESPRQVLEFLEDLAARSRKFAQRELESLNEFAGRALTPWNVPYFAEKLKQERFALDAEELRAYFPLPRVLQGLFELASDLFGLTLTEAEANSLWHPSARFYRITSGGEPVGGLLTDLFARPNKRGGAWMDGCRNRARLGGALQRPIAHLIANFPPPTESEPAYLTHQEVVTLFHEFGHCLHHLLTEIDFPSLAGINGVAWDAVELPSQFFENYAWLPDVLVRISAHRETGEPLPADKIETLARSRQFLSGLAMVRQLEFALFDFRIHAEPSAPDRAGVQAILDQVRKQVAVVPTPDFSRFQCSFSHIFGGGYAAGYYSYKWAEVLAADAFAGFEETDAFDHDTAARFRRSILAVGGSRDPMQAFVDFRGRPPKLEPLLRQAGITETAAG